ncbi:MAG: hypothetical protein IJI34_03435 [Clostridia bacterium]|nr:hypothetical protein [Clostridia bacterium]
MESISSKKQALVRMMQILIEETDLNHPMTQEQIRDRLNDRFGTELRIIPKESGLYLVRVNTNLLTAARFAIDYGQFAEVVFPQSVRSVVYHTLSAALRKYRNERRNNESIL